MSYASITLVGNVGRDPELRYTPQGVAVTDFSLAVDASYTKDGQRVEQTDWYKITCWRRQAEVVAQYVSKGKQVLVVADRIKADAYTNRDGEARATLNVTAQRVIFLQGGAQSAERNTSTTPDDDYDLPF